MYLDGCRIHIYAENDFDKTKPHLILDGPAEYPHLKNLPDARGKNWANDIDSIEVGSNAWAVLFGDENFKGKYIILGPGKNLPYMNVVGLGDDIESIIIHDHPPVW